MTKAGDRRASMPRDVSARPAVRLRRMRLDDVPAGLRLCRASRWNQVGQDWELFLTQNPDGSLVAVTDEVVGSVATIRYGDVFSWIAMMLVDPSCRGAGIGTRLLEESLRLVDDGPTVRLDATPAGYDVYRRAGFREEYPVHRMERPAPPPHSTYPAAASTLRHLAGAPARPMEDADFEEVLQLDREAFGGNRDMLLDAFRRRAPAYAWVIGRQPIEGFLVGRNGHHFEQLGPLVARDESAASRLVAACQSARPDRPFIIDVPQFGSWTRWLESLQFAVQRPFTRMYRGERRYRERLDMMFAIAGPEFG